MSVLALLLAMPVLVWGLPGWFLSRIVQRHAPPLERVTLSLTLGIVTVAPTTYLLAIATPMVVSIELVALVALFWTLAAVAWQRWGTTKREALPAQEQGNTFTDRFLLLFALVAAGFFTLTTTPSAITSLDMWWHCPHLSCLYLMEAGQGPGVISWDPEWQRWVHHLFQHPVESGFGLGPALGIQRPGNAAFLVDPVVFLSQGGLIVALFCTDFLILGYSILLLRRSVQSSLAVSILSLMFLLGVRALASYQVNENGIALALTLALLHLLWPPQIGQRQRLIPVILAVGAILGHLAGIRPVTLLLLPAVLLLLPGRGPARGLALAGALLVALVPWLTAHGLALGDPFVHPALAYGTHPHTLFAGTPFELRFTFHPLNYPFSDQLVRPPQHAFPTLFRLPLEQLQAFGAPFLALVLVGFPALARSQGARRFCGILLWVLPVPVLLMSIVGLDHQKMSYILLSFAPYPLLMGMALGRFDGGWRTRSLTAAAVVTLLVLAPLSLRDLELPIDRRAHGDYLTDPREEGSTSVQRAQLTRSSWLPYIGSDLHFLGGGLGAELLLNSRIPAAQPGTISPGPLVIWAALAPAGLHHHFVIETSPETLVPPSYFGRDGHLGVGINEGRSLFLLRLPAGSPDTVDVTFRRVDGAYRIQIHAAAHAENTADARTLSILVVDRSERVLKQPVIDLLGTAQGLYSVAVWRPEGAAFTPHPRVVSNFPWGYRWRGDGFTWSDSESVPLQDGAGATRLCQRPEAALFRTCASGPCTWVLTDRNGLPLAIRPEPGRGAASRLAFSWGPGFPPRLGGEGSCSTRFWAQGTRTPSVAGSPQESVPHRPSRTSPEPVSP